MRVVTQYMPLPLQVDNIFAFIRQLAVLFRHNNIFIFIRQVAPVSAWWLFKTSATFDIESGVRVTCDVGYLCANFSLPRPLCSRVRPDVCDRQTDVSQKHRLTIGRRLNDAPRVPDSWLIYNLAFGLSVLDLGLVYVTDRQTSDRRQMRIVA